MLTGDRLDRRRASALESDGPLVRIERRFEVYLGEYEWRRQSLLDTPESFVDRHARYVRPMLERVVQSPVFAVPTPGTPWKPVGKLAQWERAGVRPDEWQRRYFREVDGLLEVELRQEVLDDSLFWWWMIPGGAPYWPIFLTTLERFDAASFFSRVEDPTCVRNAYRGPVAKLLTFAKQQTQANDRIALRLHARMALSVIASPANVARLFEIAVSHAAFNF